MDYWIRMEGGDLRLGTQMDPKFEAVTGNSKTVRNLVKWDISTGVYRAKDIVREAGILLEAVCARLGSAAAEPLLGNLQASLAVSGREAVLPFASLATGEETKSCFLTQAEQIGTALSGWAREIYAEQLGRQRYGYDALIRLVHQSRCDQLSDYVATKEEMISRVAAWQSDRNTARSTVNWQFTTKAARIRLNRLYPEI